MKKLFIAFCLVLVTSCSSPFGFSYDESNRFVITNYSSQISVIKDTYTGQEYLLYHNGSSSSGLTHLVK